MERKACRQGNHAYGVPVAIGAGLTRRCCKYCAAFELDLRDADTAAEPPINPDHNIFRRERRISFFDIEQAVAAGLYDPDDEE